MNQRRAVWIGLVVLSLCGATHAENIDPANDDSQRAYGENVGWINAEPLGSGGPGVQVDDFELTGYLWGENVGWISLSCKNDSSCAATEYGVLNDGDGVLSGYAWSENVGWINFASATSGVSIDVSTGEFSGRAWGENIGWITFASSGANPYGVKTDWNCDPAPTVPAATPTLSVTKSGAAVSLAWNTVAGASGYDIVRGDLAQLRVSLGNFAAATEECLETQRTTSSLTVSGTPLAGNGDWFLVRSINCGGAGGYTSGAASQTAPRDPGIAASGADCPSSALRVFVTTMLVSGNFGGAATADSLCQTEASTAGLAGSFKAMLSPANATPTDATVPYFLPGGTQVALDFADWFDGNGVLSAIVENADGSAVGGTDRVWTGTDQNGNPSLDCLGWTSLSSGDTGLAGSTTQSGSGWTNWGLVTCNTQRHIYCFQIN